MHEELYWQAMMDRDYTQRGHFVCAVKTTKIYCAPGCPAKPKRQNVIFFAKPEQAEDEGFRPCKRCRPET